MRKYVALVSVLALLLVAAPASAATCIGAYSCGGSSINTRTNSNAHRYMPQYSNPKPKHQQYQYYQPYYPSYSYQTYSYPQYTYYQPAYYGYSYSSSWQSSSWYDSGYGYDYYDDYYDWY